VDLGHGVAKVGEMTLVSWQDEARVPIEVALEDHQAVTDPREAGRPSEPSDIAG